jgi:hypothetical protein
MAIVRDNSFHLLLSDDELKVLRLLAEQEGLNASDYLRLLIRRQPDRRHQMVTALAAAGTLGSDLDLARAFTAVREATASVKKKR